MKFWPQNQSFLKFQILIPTLLLTRPQSGPILRFPRQCCPLELPQVMQFSSRTVTWKLAHSRETRGVDDTGANMQNELMHKVA